ncbi:MAG: bifunctional diaminohydroxyphosphoribosylaminopyrimidine deaminase/5-amino-6-(5-phosphoribosylamino)uracil reductase RibD [Nitrospirales bacterium]|nr:bifunctional diaminohydroxyphosphoribosylaminopyrimidine deaminase/5-amino-6-(5-phosphoribosylamino)uracil reductase RibD [Nitrospirales bacterium]
MKCVLRLAAKGRGSTSPNPMVGAIVVADGQVVAQSYHAKVGGPHAEVLALKHAGEAAHGATLYVNLEPCCHINKRTPPCVPSIMTSGIRRVVIGVQDPNPLVQGQGIRRLQKSGIIVDVGCLESEAARLNEGYGHWIRTRQPFVILKAAMTLDGKIATASGESKWITGEQARKHVHRTRSQVDAILVGISTILKDDPHLTVRGLSQSSIRQPLRIVLDSRLRIPLRANILKSESGMGVLVATTAKASVQRLNKLRSKGVTVWVLPSRKGHVSLPILLKRLGATDITSVLVEGGSEVNASFIQSRLVHQVMLYVAPKLLGGDDAKNLIGGTSPKRLLQTVSLMNRQIRQMGEDFLITGVPQYHAS